MYPAPFLSAWELKWKVAGSCLSQVRYNECCNLKSLESCFSYAKGSRGTEPGAWRREKAKPPVEKRSLTS